MFTYSWKKEKKISLKKEKEKEKEKIETMEIRKISLWKGLFDFIVALLILFNGNAMSFFFLFFFYLREETDLSLVTSVNIFRKNLRNLNKIT